MRIENPYYLFGLLAIPAVIVIFIAFRRWRKKTLQFFGEWELVNQLIAGRSIFLPLLKLSILLLSLLLLIFSLANVQMGNAKKTITHEGIDIAVVLDISNSMLAEDLGPNRLAVAKQFASQLIDRLPDERIAFISFAGEPVLQTPLTIDHGATQLVLDAISTNDIPRQGTNLEAAVREGIRALPENQNHYRAMILITDGENLTGDPEVALQEAADAQMVIITAGIGTLKGATIPVTVNNEKTERKDAEGKTVITRLQPAILKKIAESGHGIYTEPGASLTSSIDAVVNQVNGISKNQFDEEILTEYESKFQWLLLPALLFMVVELFISNRKKNF